MSDFVQSLKLKADDDEANDPSEENTSLLLLWKLQSASKLRGETHELHLAQERLQLQVPSSAIISLESMRHQRELILRLKNHVDQLIRFKCAISAQLQSNLTDKSIPLAEMFHLDFTELMNGIAASTNKLGISASNRHWFDGYTVADDDKQNTVLNAITILTARYTRYLEASAELQSVTASLSEADAADLSRPMSGRDPFASPV